VQYFSFFFDGLPVLFTLVPFVMILNLHPTLSQAVKGSSAADG